MTLEKISSVIKGKVLTDEPMKKHTSYKIGGPADYYIYPANGADLELLIKLFRVEKYPFYIVGNGSNILVSDEGFRGAIIDIKDSFNTIEVNQNELSAGGGAVITKVAHIALENSLSGFEEIAGIPGTIGGAIMMNAGCYGKTISEHLKIVETVDEDGNFQKIKASELKFEYRKSGLEGKIITKALFNLRIGKKELIYQIMTDYLSKRRVSQPLSLPSCGSVFKRPVGHFAGKLIEDAGLKGYSIGGAMVSKKHAGFIINYNQATAADVVALINYIKQKVADKFKVNLEEEVIYLGF